MPLASTPITPPIDSERFKCLVQSAELATEFFLPLDRASWQGDRYTLGTGGSGGVGSQIVGVRLQAPDPANQDTSLERNCQEDVFRLVKSIRRLRQTPELAGAVLSKEFVVSRQSGNGSGKRVRFGLHCPANGRFASDEAASAECHRQISRAIHRAGFVVDQPKSFDAKTGLAGLEEWAKSLRLQRRLLPVPVWVLLLPLPLLLLLIPWNCSPGTQPSTITTSVQPPVIPQIDTQSFIILLDKSSSMNGSPFRDVKKEVADRLDQLLSSKTEAYLDLITYDATASSLLGKLKLLDGNVKQELMAKVSGLLADGQDTKLETAIKKAAEQVIEHGKPTTLVVLTDGEDDTVQNMLNTIDQQTKQFGGIKVVIKSTIFEDPNRRHDPKYRGRLSRLEAFSRAFGGEVAIRSVVP